MASIRVPVLLIIACVLSLTVVSALSVTIKPTYQPGETLITQVKGTVLEPITNDKIELVRNGYLQVPIEYDIQKLGQDYFLYLIAPQNPNNYTLIIHNVTTLVAGQVASLDIRQNFSVSGPIIPYSIKPGFALMDKQMEFIIQVNADDTLPFSIGAPINENYTLQPGENHITIANRFESGLYAVSFGTYSVPLYVLPHPTTQRKRISFYPDHLRAVVLSGRENIIPFRLINDFQSDVSNVVIQYNNSFFSINPSRFMTLKANQSLDINVTIRKNTQSFSDSIVVIYGNDSYELPVSITYTSDNNSVEVPYLTNYSQGEGKYCSELQGLFCSTSQQCSGQTIAARDGTCCIGTCKAPTAKSYAWIGYLLGLIVLLVIIIIGGRYLKSRKKNSSAASFPLTR